MKPTITLFIALLAMVVSVQSEGKKNPDPASFGCTGEPKKPQGTCILKKGDKKNPIYYFGASNPIADKKFSCQGVKINNEDFTGISCCVQDTSSKAPPTGVNTAGFQVVCGPPDIRVGL
ncbi:hypothetical protein PTTG_11646 [Puccinia triticina 1-1 BBBD Race 1]|uniref:Secreted protein n=2 Tax=Puccinia triticina TaxID=208348 RepID=A0A180GXF1_PUCT1|nr:uncharacterized protein PtA15_6A312 [Puccinia triticina]OAV96952.1 hypothetical protein PTTG_11646 [Puccinia triticina 1-1 BBBD Race 1]WAQ85684.1 hypothetical protein PtA15_6A312 [Puccinia triticina]